MKKGIDSIIETMIDQINHEIDHGLIDPMSITRDYISERAEEILSSEEYEIFSEYNGETIVYQNV